MTDFQTDWVSLRVQNVHETIHNDMKQFLTMETTYRLRRDNSET